MANEITMSLGITHTKDPRIPFNKTIKIDQTGTGVFSQPVTVGTTAETVTFTDITTPGLVIVWNLDTTHFVTVSVDVAGTPADFGTLVAGGLPAVIPWKAGAVLSLKADTAPCKCHVQVYEA